MKKTKLTIGIILILMLGSITAFAESSVYTDNGDLSVQKCISKGEIDFGVFLDSMIYNDGFEDGLIEPWRDVLARNQCQSNDIFSLIKQEDKIRSAIRMAFLTCNNATVKQLKKPYFKLMMEIYYSRHVVNSGLVIGLPVPAQISLFKDAAIVNRDQIYSDMSDKYVGKNSLTQEDFDIEFLKLENKYKSRREQYLSCDQSPWQAVGDKWHEFTKFFSEGAGVKDSMKTIGAEVASDKGPSLLNELNSIKTVELFTTKESFGEYISSWAQLNVNNLTPTASLEEAQDFVDKHLNGGTGLSQQDYVNSQSNAQNYYAFQKDIYAIKTEFDARYKAQADQSEELFLNALDGRNTGGPDDGLLEIINNSFSPLNDNLSITGKILDRQCSGSE